MSDARTNDPKTIAADIAREYREDNSRWTQKVLARNCDGFRVDHDNPGAVCWCLRGAIDRRLVPNEPHGPVYDAFDQALGHEPDPNKDWIEFVSWNDQPGRTVGEVIALCDAVANGTALQVTQP